MINIKNKERIDKLLLKYINKKSKVLACGVGDGSEIVYLRSKNYQAYGIDPSRLDKKKITKIKKFIENSEMSPNIFGKLKFDFIYAFEVFEHVGCINYGTILSKDYYNKRLFFLKSIIKKLKKNGSCFITTGNKNFIIDIGHFHKYSPIAEFFKSILNINISLPISKQNFLFNYRDFKKILLILKSQGLNFDYNFEDMSFYPSITRKTGLKSFFIRAYLKIVNIKLLRESFLNPIIGLKIKKR